MLESLGYSEAAERDEADLILFNTCSIRESADNRFIAHLGRGEAAQVRGPGAGRRRRRLLGAVGQGRGLRALPVRRRRLRPGPDPPAGRVPDLRLAHRAGLLRVRGLLRPPADEARARVPGLAADLAGLQLRLLVLHRPLDPRARAEPRPRSSWSPRSRRLAADGVREVTLLGQNVNSYGRDLPRERRTSFAELLGRVDAVDGIERIRYTSPHPKDMREDVIRAHAELPALCEHIHLPLQSGSSRILKAMRRTYDRRALPRPGGADPRARPRLRADHRHHRRLPGRDRGGLRARPWRWSRRSATTAPSPSSSRRAGAPRRRRSATRSRTRSSASGWSGWSRWSSGGPASARSASSGGRWRSWSRATRRTRPEPAARPHPPQQGGQLRGHRGAGRAGRGRDRRGDLADADRARAPAQPRLTRQRTRLKGRDWATAGPRRA